jgi:glycosyltransferase involved in cell wall biosynthesis
MKKTILFLDQQSWLGGGQRVLEAVLDSLWEEFEPIVAFPNQGPFRARLDEKGIETLTISIGDYRSGPKSWMEMVAFAFRSLLCGLKLAAVIRRRQVALVYINGPRCLPAGVFATRLTGRPCLFHLHLVLTRKLEALLTAQLARHVSRIVACSRAAAQSLLDENPRLSVKTEVLYSPVPSPVRPISERTHGKPPELIPYFTVGIVGRVTEVKGHHVLLKAAGNLQPAIRDRMRILIVGAPAPASTADLQYAGELRRLALRCGLQESVVWTGYEADPGRWCSSMDVLAHPALCAEAMGLVILEALQSKVPVIAARIGGIPEIVDDGVNGLLVTPGDENALSQALARFIDDGSLRERLQAGARSSLDDRFTLRTFSPKIRMLIRRLCDLPDSDEKKAAGEESAVWK